jgi:hypothetical protein
LKAYRNRVFHTVNDNFVKRENAVLIYEFVRDVHFRAPVWLAPCGAGCGLDFAAVSDAVVHEVKVFLSHFNDADVGKIYQLAYFYHLDFHFVLRFG